MRAGGSTFKWCKIDVAPIIHNNKPVKMIGVITNISNMKLENEVLQRQVCLDLFTGLYHKQAAITMIEQRLALQHDVSHALILLDINKFKSFNDCYGHGEGDKVIKKLADLMKANF